MFLTFSAIEGFPIRAKDSAIGHLKDGLFDDERWGLRYLVIDTGGWLDDRQVLISPGAVSQVNETDACLDVELSRDQVEHSPPISAHEPVSRHEEMKLHRYFGWPGYWTGGSVWSGDPSAPLGPAVHPTAILPLLESEEDDAAPEEPPADPHLRSMRDLTGHRIHAADGDMGHLHDFILDAASWTIRYLVIDTGSWLPGKKVLLPPQWISSMDWADRSATVNLARDIIQDAPEWTPDVPLDRPYEKQLHDYFKRPGYWSEPVDASAR